MHVSFEEIGHLSATFGCDKCTAGQVCKVSENGRVAPCADGERFCGVLESVRTGHAGVQLHGFAEVSYTGAAPAVGYTGLQADGHGGVKAAGTVSYLVVSVDTGSKTAVIEL